MKREYDILKFLQFEKRYVSIEELSRLFSIGSRTIRTDLDEVEYILKKNHLGLKRNRKYGVMIDQNGKTYEQTQKIIANLTSEDFFYTKTDKTHFIINKFLTSDKLVTIEELSILVDSSKNTTIKYINECEKWLSQYDIELIKKPSKGMYIKYREEKYRRAVLESINYYLDETDLANFFVSNYDKLTLFNSQANSFIEHYIKGVDLSNIAKLLNSFEDEFDAFLTTKSFRDVLFIITIAISRCSNSHYIEKPIMQIDKKDIVYYRWLEENYKIINKNRKLSLPSSEIQTILNAIMSYARFRVNIKKQKNTDTYLQLIDQFIAKTSKDIKIDLTDDETLRRDMYMHIKPLFYRYHSDLSRTNVLKEEIIREYSSLFKVCKKNSKILEERIGYKLSDDEVSFILLYIATSIERKKEKNNEKEILKAVLISQEGIPSNNMAVQVLNNEIPDLTVKGIPLSSINKIKKYEVDLVITTFQMRIDDYEHVEISPLINDDDIQIVKKKINRIKKINNAVVSRQANDILEILKKNKVNVNEKLSTEIYDYFSVSKK